MKTEAFKCPHCGKPIKTVENEYLYGSPLRNCEKCKNQYVDRRYHEIALDGIREEDINPSEAEIKSRRNSGLISIAIGIGSFVLFIVIIALGWIIFPLPLVTYYGIVKGVSSLKESTKGSIENKRKMLEIEKQQSFARMQNPQYVEQLRAAGFNVSVNNQPSNSTCSTPQSAQPQASPKKVCAMCGAELLEDAAFCNRCGTKI